MQSHSLTEQSQIFINSQTNVEVPASSFAAMAIVEIQTNLRSLIKDLSACLDSFKKSPGSRRVKDIEYLKELLVVMTVSIDEYKFKTADKLAVKFYKYLTSTKFTTGLLNRSQVRESLFNILESYYPEMFSENESVKKNFFSSIEEFEYASESIKKEESSFVIIAKLKRMSDERIKNLNYANSIIVRNGRHESKTEATDYNEINEDLKTNLDEEKKTIEICQEQINAANGTLDLLITDLAMQELIRTQLNGCPNRIKVTDVGLTTKDKATYIKNEVKMRFIDFKQALTEAITAYETQKGQDLSNRRKENIKKIKEIVDLYEGVTADGSVNEINDYLNSKDFETGLLNNSQLRDLIIEVLKAYCPTIYVNPFISDQFKRKEHYEELTDKIEKAFKRIQPHCSSIIDAACDRIEIYGKLLAEAISRKNRTDELADQKLAKVNYELLQTGLLENIKEEKESVTTLSTQEIRVSTRIMLFKKQFDSQRELRSISYPENSKLAKPEQVKSVIVEEEKASVPDFR